MRRYRARQKAKAQEGDPLEQLEAQLKRVQLEKGLFWRCDLPLQRTPCSAHSSGADRLEERCRAVRQQQQLRATAKMNGPTRFTPEADELLEHARTSNQAQAAAQVSCACMLLRALCCSCWSLACVQLVQLRREAEYRLRSPQAEEAWEPGLGWHDFSPTVPDPSQLRLSTRSQP